jgi:hypothetical protein
MLTLYSIVIPYKRNNTDELTYAVRSLKNFPHKDIWIIGDKPEGLDLTKVHHIPYRQTRDIVGNSLEILRIACTTSGISDDFVWWHDDMFALQPIKRLPIYYTTSYKDILDRTTIHNLYVSLRRNTYRKLTEIGIKDPLYFDVHQPFIFNKQKVLDIFDHLGRVNKISFYANYYGIKGIQIGRDLKVRRDEPPVSNKLVSTYDSSYRVNTVGDRIRSLFYEKSQYEDTGKNILPVVHMIWIGSPLPRKYAINIQSYKRQGYAVKIWTKPPKLVNQELYDRAIPYALKADIMRLEILYQEGGLYVDIDSFMSQKLPIESSLVCSTSASGYIANEMIYAAKGHPAIKEAIERMAKHVKKLKVCNIWQIAGATYITPIFEKYPHVKLPKKLVGAKSDRPSTIQQQYDGSWSVGIRKSDILPLEGGWLK